MDLNLRIISAVKDCPMLYKTNATIAQRQVSWKQLSEKSQLQEHFLKSRWHFLREQYKKIQNENGGYFRYAAEMEFLRPYIRNHTATATELALKKESSDQLIEPEFIITEKDIENDSDNEEYVFLEVDGLEVNADEEQSTDKTETQLNSEQLKEQLEECDTLPELKSISEKIERKTSIDTPAQNDPDISKVTREQKQQKQSLIKRGQVIEDKHETHKDQEKHDSEEKHQVENADNNIRCEDVIFGELVTAMLKRMTPEKKRSVKKDIMNLLLT